jgi:hypothetical protein
MMLSRRLMMGKGRTTYVWAFDVVENNKGNINFIDRYPSDLDFQYLLGTTLPDMFTSSYTATEALNIMAERGTPGVGSTLNRPYVGIRFLSGLRADIDFHTDYPFKPGATIELYNVTEDSLMDSWSGTDSHADAFLNLAGHYFYPNNQTTADVAANNLDDYDNVVGLSDGDIVELRITV